MGLPDPRQHLAPTVPFAFHACHCDRHGLRQACRRYREDSRRAWHSLAPDFGRGLISNGREGTVSVFELNSLKVHSKVKVGENPDAILYDPASKRVFTFNGRSHDATAIDAAKRTVIGTGKLKGKPEFAVSDEEGEVFVNLEQRPIAGPGSEKV